MPRLFEIPAHERPTLILTGPTASGKSGLARALAQPGKGAIINADSMQVYQDLRILTARPTEAEETMLPHHLYGFAAGATPCSVGQWLNEVHRVISAVRTAGLWPIIVGGSGLYLKALLEGLAPVPKVPEEIARDTARLVAAKGLEDLRARLQKVDPVMADRLHPADRQRIERAWNVFQATGRSLADWQRMPRCAVGAAVVNTPFESLKIVLARPRHEIYERCDQRFLEMMDRGAVDEVRQLLAGELDPELPIMKALGVRQLAAFLTGDIDEAQAVLRAQTATRQYAKRQMTWFRHQFREWLTLDTQDYESFFNEIVVKI